MNTVLVEINPQTAFILTIFHAVPSETVNNLRMISRRLFCRDTNAAESDQSGELRRQNSVSQYLIARNSLRRSSTSPIISYLGICPMLPSRRNYSAMTRIIPMQQVGGRSGQTKCRIVGLVPTCRQISGPSHLSQPALQLVMPPRVGPSIASNESTA
jgi:hypothetical protein